MWIIQERSDVGARFLDDYVVYRNEQGAQRHADVLNFENPSKRWLARPLADAIEDAISLAIQIELSD